MIEVLKQALDALEVEDLACRYEKEQTPEHIAKAITSLRQALAELESQEPDYWLGYGLQAHTEKPFENATALYIHPPQRIEQNFCQRCGKRTNDIHTCTPPQNIEQEGKQMIDWYSVEGETRSYGVGMVACVYAIGRDEVVHVVTHESVKDIAMQHLPIQRTWVGLTNDDLTNLLYDTNLGQQSAVLQAIALLKEKNT